MGEKARNSATIFDDNGVDLKPREMKVLERRLSGSKQKSVQQIAKELGVERTTVYRDLAKIKESGWFEKQTTKMQAVEGLVFAGFVANILGANPDLIKSYYKGLGVWRDKLEVSGSIEQKLSDKEITEKAKQVILEVIQEAKAKSQVKAIEEPKRQEISQSDKGCYVDPKSQSYGRIVDLEPSSQEPRPPSPKPPNED